MVKRILNNAAFLFFRTMRFTYEKILFDSRLTLKKENFLHIISCEYMQQKVGKRDWILNPQKHFRSFGRKSSLNIEGKKGYVLVEKLPQYWRGKPLMPRNTSRS